MPTKTALGETEHHVLLAAVRLGAGADTVAIVRELEHCAGRDVTPAGCELLKASRARLLRLWEGLDPLWRTR